MDWTLRQTAMRPSQLVSTQRGASLAFGSIASGNASGAESVTGATTEKQQKRAFD